MLAKKALWSRWSQIVGLQENYNKTQFVGASQKHVRKLLEAGVEASEITKVFEILGVSAGLQSRQLATKEIKRIQDSTKVIRVLSCLRLGFNMFHVAARLFAMSRCAYGWISRLPTQAVCKKLWAELRLGQQTLKAASPYLRCVLTGGLSHLDCIAGVNLIRIVHFMKHGSQINWQAGRGSPLAVLKQWLKDKGWAIVQPWVWAVQNSFFRLDLRRPGNDFVSHLQHQLRMGWRWFNYGLFLNQERHDNHELNGSVEDFLTWDFDGMRNQLQVGPAYRTLLLGAARSPACFHSHANFDTTCIWDGCDELGHWDHIAWTCPYRPSSLTCCDHMSRRFGWWKVGDTMECADWLSKVVSRIWETRYPKGVG